MGRLLRRHHRTHKLYSSNTLSHGVTHLRYLFTSSSLAAEQGDLRHQISRSLSRCIALKGATAVTSVKRGGKVLEEEACTSFWMDILPGKPPAWTCHQSFFFKLLPYVQFTAFFPRFFCRPQLISYDKATVLRRHQYGHISFMAILWTLPLHCTASLFLFLKKSSQGKSVRESFLWRGHLTLIG